MGSGPTILRRARGRTSALDLDTEAGRAFLQERLAFYNKVTFFLSGGFFLVGLLLMVAGMRPPEEVSAGHERRAALLHAATLVVQLSAWLACSRARRLGPGVLRAIDAGSLGLSCLGFALQSVTASAPHVEQMGPFPRVTLLLILTNVLIARAVFVPSPSAWTAAVSTAAALPVVASAGFGPALPGAPPSGGVMALWAGLWAACAAIVATLASRVIYGLREEVREARRHVLRQVSSALAEAHGIGLVHRDVKPENIILCERGGVPDVAKVVDFGLVKDLERGGAALSRADVVQGTPLYLSPEAITAPDRVGPRGDLYALGAVGYYMVTGQHVFSGATLVEVCSHHLHTRPEPPSARRPASALALREALREVPGVGSWTEEEARAWWDTWRSRRPASRPPGGEP